MIATITKRFNVQCLIASRREVLSAKSKLKLVQTLRANTTFASQILGSREERSSSGYMSIGAIPLEKNERLVYFDNIYPLRFSRFDVRYYFARLLRFSHNADVIRFAFANEPKGNLRKVVPRIKFGGAYAVVHKATGDTLLLPVDTSAEKPSKSRKRTIREDTQPEQPPPQEQQLLSFNGFGEINESDDFYEIKKLASRVSKSLSATSARPWFNPFQRITCYPVSGRPFIEDLNVFPSSIVSVNFEGPAFSSEQVYRLMRPFGRIRLITVPSSGEKGSFYVAFSRVRSATAAVACLYGAKVGDTRVTLDFKRRVKVNSIKRFIMDHPRLSLPLLAALLGIFTAMLFDPIRNWFASRFLSLSSRRNDSGYVKRLQKLFERYTKVSFSRGGSGNIDSQNNALSYWAKSKDMEDELLSYMNELENGFIVIEGPKGSGKDEIVDLALKNKKFVLNIDCEGLFSAQNDSQLLKNLASQVGYWPLFTWMNSLMSMVDFLAQGLIGSKSEFKESTETQLRKIMDTTSSALRKNFISQKPPESKNLDEKSYFLYHPEGRPVVVLKNFLFKTEKDHLVYKIVSKWAATLLRENIAHVIVVTEEPGYKDYLVEQMPDRKIRSVELSDVDKFAALDYVKHQLLSISKTDNDAKQKLEPILDDSDTLRSIGRSISILGGRLSDLDYYVQRIRAGEQSVDAIDNMLKQSTIEISKMLFNLENEKDTDASKWYVVKAWPIIQALASEGHMRYNEAVQHPLVERDSGVIDAMRQQELVYVVEHQGRPSILKPGKPLYKEAFRNLVADPYFSNSMTLYSVLYQKERANKKISDCISELSKISDMSTLRELSPRVTYLVQMTRENQQKVDKLEKEQRQLQKIISDIE